MDYCLVNLFLSDNYIKIILFPCSVLQFDASIYILCQQYKSENIT